MRLNVDPVTFACLVLREHQGQFITVRELAKLLGVSTKLAGKILRRLERAGVVERWSRTAYRVKAVEKCPAYNDDNNVDQQKLRTVSFKLEEKLLKALDHLARIKKKPRSELIREAIVDLLKKYGVEVEA